MGRGARGPARVVALAASLMIAAVAGAAERGATNVPTPPPRPRDIGEEPGVVNAPASPAPSAPAPAVDEDADHPLRRLSQAELRARIRGCAVKWSRMKRDGAAVGMLWNDFARDCLGGK